MPWFSGRSAPVMAQNKKMELIRRSLLALSARKRLFWRGRQNQQARRLRSPEQIRVIRVIVCAVIVPTVVCLGREPIQVASPSAHPSHAVRARDLGIPFDGTPGELNAITDVAGVEVGYATLI